MTTGTMRFAIAALMGALPLAAVSPAWPQTAAKRAYNASELNLIYSLTYQSSQAQAALARQYSAKLNQQKKAIDAKDAQLGAARRAAKQSQASIEVLERELATLKEGFTAELAAKDSDFARERAILTTVGEDLLKTPDGKRALELYLIGGQGAYEAADQILQKAQKAREAAMAATARKQSAGDFRTRAALALDARNKGKTTSEVVLKLYEAVVAADPGTHWDWVELTRLYRKLNNLGRASVAAEQAIRTASDQRDRSVGLNELGDILVSKGDLGGALARYEEGLVIARSLAKLDPTSAEAQRDVSVILVRVGDVLDAQGDIDGALARYEEGFAIARTLLKLDPSSASAQRGVSVSLERVGGILVEKGDLGGALARYEESLVIRRTLAKPDPSLASAQRDVFVSLEGVGDILVAKGDLVGALARFEEGLGIVRTLAKLDPSSVSAQRDVSASLTKGGDVLLANGDLDGALARYQEGLGIRRTLARLEPSSASVRRDLSVSLAKVGDISFAKGDIGSALARYEEGLAIARTLAKLDPSSASAQRDVSVSLTKVGDSLAMKGDLAGALARYEEDFGISRSLAKLDPSSATAQRDVMVSLSRLAAFSNQYRWSDVLELMLAMQSKGQLLPDDQGKIETVRKFAAEQDAQDPRK